MTKKEPKAIDEVHTNAIFSQLSENQWRFVTAMVENPAYSKKEAAEHIGMNPQTIYKWGDLINRAVELARRDIHSAALDRRKQAVLKAISVKLALLDSDDENVRSKAASEIINWELGQATQKQDLTTNGKDLTFTFVYPDDDELRKLAGE